MDDGPPFLLDDRDAAGHATNISQLVQDHAFGHSVQRTLRGLEASIGGLS
jgi:hypothetical protein